MYWYNKQNLSFVRVWENQFCNKFETDIFISYQFVILFQKIMEYDFHKENGGSREIQTSNFCNILYSENRKKHS